MNNKNKIASEKVLKVLEWDSVVRELSSRCSTSLGRSVIDSLEALSIDKIKDQLKKISEIKRLIIEEESPDFSGISGIGTLVDLSTKDGVLSIDELCMVRDFIRASDRIINYIHKYKDKLPSVSEEFNSLHKFSALSGLLTSSITDGNELNSSKYKILKQIRENISRSRHEIEDRLRSVFHSPVLSTAIQEKVHSMRNERYVILVKANMKDKVKGNIHDISASGATLYVEPNEVIELNTRLIMLGRQLQNEIFKILKNLSGEIAKSADELLFNMTMLARLDFLSAGSKFSISIKGNEAEITDQKIITLYRARHPLLFLMNPKVIPNDLSIGIDFNCMIISGANTGGKTVLLKTVGLCVLLAMHGLHVPADPDSSIGMFTNILADIGDDQSILESLSTYSGQIVILKEMLESADKNTLILIDEILVGTNPRQGAVLAQAALETLAEKDAIIILTTHYSDLKELPFINKKFQNASVSFDVNSIKPTFKLRTGIPGTSYAIDIAKNYGLDEKIIQRAKELLDSSEISTDALIENIQKHKEEIEEEYAKINDIKKELAEKENNFLEKQSKLNLRIEDVKNEKGIEFLEEIDRYKKEITGRLKNMQYDRQKELEKLRENLSEMASKISCNLSKERKKRFTHRYRAFHPDHAGPGNTVFIVPIEKTGIISEVDETGRNISVILGNSIKARYKYEDILIPIDNSKKKQEKPAARKKPVALTEENAKTEVPFTMQTQYNTSDLRGMTVDEALERLDRDFDRMIRGTINAAVVIHGHGTGALKNAVREWFKTSYYVKVFRPGTNGEGGDGVSIVLLKG